MLQDNNYFSPNNNVSNVCSDFNQPKNTSCTDQNGPFLAKIVTSVDGQEKVETGGECNGSEMSLSVEQNDVIVIERRENGEQFYARSDKQYGLIPSHCCQILDYHIPTLLCQYLADNNYYDLYVCFASFVALDVGDLSITKGDIIVAISQVNEHWMQGRVCFDSQANSWSTLIAAQQVGTFPLNHCWLLDPERVKSFCHDKIEEYKRLIPKQLPSHPPFGLKTHSSSLSIGSSSLHSSDYQPQTAAPKQSTMPPPRPQQLPQRVVQHQVVEQLNLKPQSIITTKQQDKLKGWLNTVKKKTARLSTRITASLGLITLTRDEEFERHYDSFKHIEKTIRAFIKNLTIFVEHFESFLLSLQNTSEYLSDFYRDKSHQRELEELRKKNKALACEHFRAFRMTVDRQVVTVANKLLQKFSGPHQLISKRSAKLLDYDNKTKEMESCSDLKKKENLRDQYVIAKDLYDRLNRQLIEELPIFNQFAIDIFRECILVLLESRKNLILSYTKQTASLLDTPLMMTYTASDVASSILMSCDMVRNFQEKQCTEINELIEQSRKDSGQTSGHDTKPSSTNDDDFSRPHSVASQLSSEFDKMAFAAREISSTPLSQVSENKSIEGPELENDKKEAAVKFDEPDCSKPKPSVCADSDRDTHNRYTGEPTNSEDCEPVARKDVPREKRRKKKFQIYVASWPFAATGPNQLTIACMQPLKLIKGCDECGNSDWSLVQDKKGQLGYVPSSYIKKKE